MTRCFLWLVLAMVSLGGTAVLAQDAPTSDGSMLRVYVLTMQPGEAVYEKFGHNAIWIHDAGVGRDYAYNYGQFTFEDNFVWNFLSARMWYWMDRDPAAAVVRYYAEIQGRTVWAQELNLTPRQKERLRDRLELNKRPENKKYLYDYYTANCSTKVLDVLDEVLDGRVNQSLRAQPAPMTYRDHTRRSMRSNLIVYVALHAALGPYADQPLTAREEAFLPEKLQEHLRKVTVLDSGGNAVPLVLAETVVGQGTKSIQQIEVPQWAGRFFVAGLLVGVALVILARMAPRRSWAKAGVVLLAWVWTLIIGVGGATMFGFLFTSHVAAHRNENLLQVNPLALALVVLMPAMVLGYRWAYRPAVAIAGVIAGGAVLGFLMQALPWFNQVNGEIIALALPINAGLAAAAWTLSRTIPIRSAEVPLEVSPAASSGKPGKKSKRRK